MKTWQKGIGLLVIGSTFTFGYFVAKRYKDNKFHDNNVKYVPETFDDQIKRMDLNDDGRTDMREIYIWCRKNWPDTDFGYLLPNGHKWMLCSDEFRVYNLGTGTEMGAKKDGGSLEDAVEGANKG